MSKKQWNFDYKNSESVDQQVAEYQTDTSLNIDALCDIAEAGGIDEMKKYFEKYSQDHSSNLKESISGNREIIHPYNTAFNSHQYEFATEYQKTITEILGKDIFYDDFS